jgi:AbiU2
MTHDKKRKVGKNELEGLLQEIFQLRLEWSCFECLFMHSATRIELLNEYLKNFAIALRVSLSYNIVSALCRITDSRSDTLTLKNMVDNYPACKSTYLELCSVMKRIRPFRHKLVAHRDRDVALGMMSLSLPELGETKRAVDLAEQVSVEIGLAIDRACRSFSNATVEYNIDWLHACLAFGASHKREVAELKVAIRKDAHTAASENPT